MNRALLLALLVAASGASGPSGANRQAGSGGRTAAAGRQDGDPRPGTEGPLSNDCFLPTSTPAQALLDRGDAAFARAREARAAGRQDARRSADRLVVEALEAWHEALGAAEAGASVWVEPSTLAERRLTEGLRAAVARRVDGLDAAERATWRERFGAAAGVALAAAGGDPRALAEVERRHPGTRAAARAALIAGDRALEAGGTARARAHWRRAAEEAARTGDAADDALSRAIERRLAATRAPSAGAAAWRDAVVLAPAGALALADDDARLAPHRVPAPNGGVRPGLAFLGDDRLVVQTAGRVHVLRVGADAELRGEHAFEPDELLPELLPELDVRDIGRRPPGWRLIPLAAGDDVVLVVGRQPRWAEESNALVCLRPPADRSGGADPARAAHAPLARDAFLPRLRWAVVGDVHVAADGAESAIAELASLGPIEFQPGPVLAGDAIVVQAREYAGDVRAWLLAFDREHGELRWQRLLASGSDLLPDLGRTGADLRLRARLAGQPLLAVDGRVLAGTHLGACALVEALDGRPLWSFKNRRRPPDDPGWDGGRPLLAEGSEGAAGADAVLWAPFDSDRLYALRPTALADLPPRGGGTAAHEALWAGPPRRVGESLFLVGGDPPATVVLGRAGGERTVSELRSAGAERLDALYLGPDEEFQGRGLASATRVLASTDRGLYLFDRTRELYLLDYAPLAPVGSVTRGGDVYARGSLVVALSRDGLWAYRTE